MCLKGVINANVQKFAIRDRLFTTYFIGASTIVNYIMTVLANKGCMGNKKILDPQWAMDNKRWRING